MKILRIAIVLGLASGALEALEVSRLFESFSRGDAQVLRIESPAGDIRIRESRDRTVDGELVLSCAGQIGPCREVAEKIRFGSAGFGAIQLLSFDLPEPYEKRLKSFRTNGVTNITDTKWDKSTAETKQRARGRARTSWKLSAELQVAVPPYERFELALGDGNLLLERLQGAALIRVHSGSVQLSASRSAVGSVDIQVKNGRARLSGAGPGVVAGKRIQWQGPGKDALEIDVVRGVVVVTLN